MKTAKEIAFIKGPKNDSITSYYVLSNRKLIYEEALDCLYDNVPYGIYRKLHMIEEQEQSVAEYCGYKYCMIFHDY